MLTIRSSLLALPVLALASVFSVALALLNP